MKKYLYRTTLIGLVGYLSGTVAGAQHLADLSNAALIDEIRSREIGEREAEEILGRFVRRSDRVEALGEMFRDASLSTIDRIEATIVLGIHRGVEARDALTSYIQRPLPPTLSFTDANVLRHAISSLGYIADDVAIEMLKKLATKNYWEERETKPDTEVSFDGVHPAQSAERTQYEFRDSALLGICLSKRRDTIEIMEELIASGAVADMNATLVENYLTEAQYVSDVVRGLRQPQDRSDEVE
jgi:hypothetical protein